MLKCTSSYYLVEFICEIVRLKMFKVLTLGTTVLPWKYSIPKNAEQLGKNIHQRKGILHIGL